MIYGMQINNAGILLGDLLIVVLGKFWEIFG